jgi:hypothetical protein
VILIRTDLNPGEKPLAAAAARGCAREVSAPIRPRRRRGRIAGSAEGRQSRMVRGRRRRRLRLYGSGRGRIYKIAAFQELTKDSLTHSSTGAEPLHHGRLSESLSKYH